MAKDRIKNLNTKLQDIKDDYHFSVIDKKDESTQSPFRQPLYERYSRGGVSLNDRFKEFENKINLQDTLINNLIKDFNRIIFETKSLKEYDANLSTMIIELQEKFKQFETPKMCVNDDYVKLSSIDVKASSK